MNSTAYPFNTYSLSHGARTLTPLPFFSVSQTHTHTLSRSRSFFSVSLTHTHTHTHTRARTHTHTRTQTRKQACAITQTHVLHCTLSRSLAHFHALSHTSLFLAQLGWHNTAWLVQHSLAGTTQLDTAQLGTAQLGTTHI